MSPSSPVRVAVTGLGLVSAVGLDERAVWSCFLEGRSGIAEIRGFDVSDNAVRNGAEVDLEAFDRRPQISQARKLRRADRTVRFAVEATRQALDQADLLGEADEPRDIANIWGCGCGPAGTLYDAHRRFSSRGPAGMRPSTVPNCMANSVSAEVSIRFRLTGTNQVIVSACTSSTNAIGTAFRMIRDGYAETALCGGVDAFFDPFYYGVWNNLGVLSRIPEPERALRPFDSGRAGTLLGEGAGALVLERWTRAERRGARVRGEILGYGESSDASHITGPAVAGQVAAMRAALADAAVPAEAIGYVNAHGTGTEANDATESRSIHEALGSAAEGIPVGAMKSFFGHTLGASGALESIATLLALEAGVLPPNLNLERQDPDCRLKLLGPRPDSRPVELAMKNSFGFGGGNGVLILGAAERQGARAS